MNRATTQPAAVYVICPECHERISRPGTDSYLWEYDRIVEAKITADDYIGCRSCGLMVLLPNEFIAREIPIVYTEAEP